MILRPAAMIAACLSALAAGSAAAQSPWPEPAQQQAPAPWPQQPQSQPPAGAPAPWPQQPQQSAPLPQAAWPQQPAQPPQESACIREFGKLREEATRRAGAIQTIGSRKTKPTAQEACTLFTAFSGAEAKMIKFVSTKAKECGIPPEVLVNMEKSHARTTEIRGRACQAAQAGAHRPAAGPSLSDALNAPVPDSGNIRTGRGGTFDTLTGTPLGK